MGEKVYGYHAIEEALKKAGHGSTLYLVRGERERSEELDRKARLTGKVAVKKISKQEMDRMVPGIDHRGALLDLSGPRRGASRLTEISVNDFCSKLKDDEGALVLILDGLTDPHNLGAILRSADQFGVDLVIIPERRSVQANETVLKVSSGAAQYVPLSVDMSGTSSYEEKFSPRTAIVMGSEGDGISQLVRKNCDHITSIPMHGHIDSLNVSVATGILLYEFRRSNPRQSQ